MATFLIKLAVVVLFGVVVGGGVYLVLFIDEFRRERAAQRKAVEQELARGEGTPSQAPEGDPSSAGTESVV